MDSVVGGGELAEHEPLISSLSVPEEDFFFEALGDRVTFPRLCQRKKEDENPGFDSQPMRHWRHTPVPKRSRRAVTFA